MCQKDKRDPEAAIERDRERRRPGSDAAAMRLKRISASLNLPVAAFNLAHSRAALPRVFGSREEEAAEVLRLYFAVDDMAARLRFLELLRGLPGDGTEAVDEKV